jgi:hypothetical protein
VGILGFGGIEWGRGEESRRIEFACLTLLFGQGYFSLFVHNMICLQGCFAAGANCDNGSVILGMKVSLKVR